MNARPDCRNLLVLPRLNIQNANAISSPLTHGFPAMSAFLGLAWALERKLAGRYGLGFDGVGVICHHHEEQSTRNGYTRSFRLTRNPVGKDGGSAAIVEEGRIHLELTLVFGVIGSVTDAGAAEQVECARTVADTLAQMRVAGGSVLPFGPRSAPRFVRLDEDTETALKEFRRLRRSWLPGFALVSRDDLLAARLAALCATQPGASVLDAWLDLARFNWRPVPKTGADPAAGAGARGNVFWQHDRKGWLVPIPVGYSALSPLQPPGAVARARDGSTPLRFVESVYSFGEWVSPHRLQRPQHLLWYADSDPEAGLYRLRNDYNSAGDLSDDAPAAELESTESTY